jgi:SAM-dependent methyltransferase
MSIRVPRLSPVGGGAVRPGRRCCSLESPLPRCTWHPVLPFADESFDDVTCCVSVDYLIHPVTVFREVARVLRPSGRFVLTFSNRCFPTKAIQGWLDTGDEQHVQIVAAYFAGSAAFGRSVPSCAPRQVPAIRCTRCGHPASRRRPADNRKSGQLVEPVPHHPGPLPSDDVMIAELTHECLGPSPARHGPTPVPNASGSER